MTIEQLNQPVKIYPSTAKKLLRGYESQMKYDNVRNTFTVIAVADNNEHHLVESALLALGATKCVDENGNICSWGGTVVAEKLAEAGPSIESIKPAAPG